MNPELKQVIEEDIKLQNLQERILDDLSKLVDRFGEENELSDETNEFERRIWEHKREYELKTNPKQEHLNALIDFLQSEGYNLKIFDPHSVLKLPTEKQSYERLWFVGWNQEVHIYGRKVDEEIMVKKKVFWCGPLTFWYTGLHYLVTIYKNSSSITDKTLLNLIKHGSPQPSKKHFSDLF